MIIIAQQQRLLLSGFIEIVARVPPYLVALKPTCGHSKDSSIFFVSLMILSITIRPRDESLPESVVASYC